VRRENTNIHSHSHLKHAANTHSTYTLVQTQNSAEFEKSSLIIRTVCAIWTWLRNRKLLPPTEKGEIRPTKTKSPAGTGKTEERGPSYKHRRQWPTKVKSDQKAYQSDQTPKQQLESNNHHKNMAFIAENQEPNKYSQLSQSTPIGYKVGRNNSGNDNVIAKRLKVITGNQPNPTDKGQQTGKLAIE
ncbi:3511_t:CDS:2, partial [Ambispora gerdemannii]